MQTTPQQCDSQIRDSNPRRAAVLPGDGNRSLHAAEPTRGPQWRPQALSCPPPREKQARVDLLPSCLERASCFIFPILGKGSTTPYLSLLPGGRLEPQDPALSFILLNSTVLTHLESKVLKSTEGGGGGSISIELPCARPWSGCFPYVD